MFKKFFAFVLFLFILVDCIGCSNVSNVPVTVSSDSSDVTLDASNNTREGGSTLNITESVTSETEALPTSDSSPTTETAAATSDDIAALIDKNLDIILTGETGEINDTFFYKECEFIDAHPNEFAQIVALGEQALPYLDNIGKSFDCNSDWKTQYRCLMAMYAQYAIKPELYDLVFPSPDGKYAVKASVSSFFGLLDPFMGIDYCDVRIIDYAIGAVLLDEDVTYNNIKVDWSPDSRYAAVSQGIQRYGQRMYVFDIRNVTFITLPYDEIAATIRDDLLDEGVLKKTIYTDELIYYYSFRLYFDEWIAEDIKIGIELIISASNGGIISGWYSYDLIESKIVAIKFNIAVPLNKSEDN